MKLFPFNDPITSHDFRGQERSLPDWYIREVLGQPKTGPEAVKQASYGAHDLEADREASR